MKNGDENYKASIKELFANKYDRYERISYEEAIRILEIYLAQFQPNIDMINSAQPERSIIIDIHKMGDKYFQVLATEREISKNSYENLKGLPNMENAPSIFDEMYKPKI